MTLDLNTGQVDLRLNKFSSFSRIILFTLASSRALKVWSKIQVSVNLWPAGFDIICQRKNLFKAQKVIYNKSSTSMREKNDA